MIIFDILDGIITVIEAVRLFFVAVAWLLRFSWRCLLNLLLLCDSLAMFLWRLLFARHTSTNKVEPPEVEIDDV